MTSPAADAFSVIIGALGVWGIVRNVTLFIEEQCLIEPQRAALREAFEKWWISIAEQKPRYFAVSIARAVSNAADRFLGKPLFSKTSFRRSTAIATSLLLISLAFASFVSREDVAPWAKYQKTIDTIKSATERHSADAANDSDIKAALEFNRMLVARYGTLFWKVTYCCLFWVLLALTNSLLFFLATELSRMILREVVAAGRLLSALGLFALNLFLVVSAATSFLLFASIIAYPVLWFFVPIAYFLSKASVYWLIAIAIGGGIGSWVLGSPFLKIFSAIAVLPFLASIGVCGFSLVAMIDRKRFHNFCCAILLRCAGEKPLLFIAGTIYGLVVLIVTIYRLLR